MLGEGTKRTAGTRTNVRTPNCSLLPSLLLFFVLLFVLPTASSGGWTLPAARGGGASSSRRRRKNAGSRAVVEPTAAASGDSIGGMPASTATQRAPKQQQQQQQQGDGASDPSSSSLPPHWRVVPVDDVDGASRVLNARAAWSDACYREALRLHRRFTGCTDSYVAGPIRTALQCLDHAYRLYGPDHVVCSFNGGKDAAVILHLVRAAAAAYHHSTGEAGALSRPRVVYFDHADEFPEIRDFVRECAERYDLDLVTFPVGTKFPLGLRVLVEANQVADAAAAAAAVTIPLAFVLGTRTTDPNAMNQQQFAPSSHYMPPFMRVNPVLEWSYGHVWHFLRLFQLPYCVLYDRGYTSLGTVRDTQPCPALAVAGSSRTASLPRYWPAYMLRDWDQERAGRAEKRAARSRRKKSSQAAKAERLSDAAEPPEYSVNETVSSIGHLSTMSEGRVLRQQSQLLPTIEQEEPLDVTRATVADSESAVSYSDDTVTQKTVGVLIIGDEILKGFTADTNTQVAAKALREQNVLLQRVVVVSDDQEQIVQEINRLSDQVDVIITSGGVGPTHDDVTIRSVAAACKCEMVLHDEMAQLLRDKMGDDKGELSEAQIKMATLPSASKLRYLSGSSNDWPVLQCKNIFILPGIPEFFAAKIENVAEYLSCQLERSQAFKVVLSVDENSIVPVLNQVVENHPNVSIGSYPFVSHPDFKTVITVEGRLLGGGRSNSAFFDRDLIQSTKDELDRNVQLALDELINKLPSGSVLRVDNEGDLLFS